jgi:phospholipid/cholesterol/gamma-HCH transport system substrate-binding protein
MENKSHALMAGIFTIVLLAGAILVALWLNRDREERVPYQIATKLSVPGLNPQAAVRYRGLDVGRVDEIGFDPQTPGQIVIRLSVKPDTPVTRSTFAMLGYQGVTGIAYVQLDDDGKNPERVSTSAAQVARIDLRPSLLDNLQTKGLAIMDQAEELTRRFNALLGEDNQKALLGTFDNVGRAAAALEAIPKQLEPTLAKLPALATEAQRSMHSIGRLSNEYSALAGRLSGPEGPFTKISNSADSVATAADRIERDFLPLADDARASLRVLNRTLESLNDRPQSILFGARPLAPGPGENGFTEPSAP